MSAFTESALLKKLAELNSSQQSIQTLSLWLIHHRKHHSVIVKTWMKELHNVSENKKLIFMFLANDVIQNSKKKGPEYGKEYATVLPKVFSLIGDSCKSDKVIASLGRILNIWEERGVYDPKTIIEYRARLHKEHAESAGAGGAGGGSTPEADHPVNPDKVKPDKVKPDKVKPKATNTEEPAVVMGPPAHKPPKHETHEKRKSHDDSSNAAKAAAKIKRARTAAAAAAAASEERTAEPSEQNGDAAGAHLSPYLPLGEPPEPEELIKALTSIENSASSDAAVRERIANLPKEISEISCLGKLEDKDQAKSLARQVNEAVELLNDYNTRLAVEMEERTKLASMLRDFQAEQKELLAQAEQRLDEYKKKLGKIMAVQKEIKDHLSNLPDLTQLPDVTGGLAPLPSAGDLFNIH